jgi:hypothetical protein
MSSEDWWVTPYRKFKDISQPITLDEKINIFSERINGWKIDIAEHLMDGFHTQVENGTIFIEGNPHASYATLDIIFSYFEMIGKYYYGYIGEETEGKTYFKKGFLLVFREDNIEKKELETLVNELITILYKWGRCVMYHIGLTSPLIFLSNLKPQPITLSKMKSSTKKCVTINPRTLVKVVKLHFNSYINQLKDVQNTTLRTNFEKRFDLDTL